MFQKILGKGTYSKVVECSVVSNPLLRVALKVFRGESSYDDACRDEVKVLQQLAEPLAPGGPPTPFLLQPLDTIAHPKHHVIVFPLCAGSLYDLIRLLKQRRGAHFATGFIRKVALQILLCLKEVHSRGLVHTDIKPENILLESLDVTEWPSEGGARVRLDLINANVKVHDFGSAVPEPKGAEGSTIQTRHYRAPEVIYGCTWSHKADIWSVGCLLAELGTGKATLFMTHHDEEHLAMIERTIGHIPFEKRKMVFGRGRKFEALVSSLQRLWRAGKPRSCFSLDYIRRQQPLREMDCPHRRLASLCEKMMEWDPQARLSAAEALRDPFFEEDA